MKKVIKHIEETKTSWRVGSSVVITLAALIMLAMGVSLAWIVSIASVLISACEYCPGLIHETTSKRWGESILGSDHVTARTSLRRFKLSDLGGKLVPRPPACPSKQSPVKAASSFLRRKRAAVKSRVRQIIKLPRRYWRGQTFPNRLGTFRQRQSAQRSSIGKH